MPVRANWFLDDVRVGDSDPFGAADAPPAPRVQDVGVEFDLRDPDMVLAGFADLIQVEADLWDQGVTCAVRDRNDTNCSACVFAHHDEDGHRLQRLCQVGREMERVVTTHAHLIDMRNAGGQA